MGITSSKEQEPAWKTTSLQSYSHYLISKTRCDAVAAPPPLPPPGATPPPPPPDEPKAAARAKSTTAAATAAPPPPPPDSIEQAAEDVGAAVPNPGPYEHVSMDAKRLVSLDTHDGMRFDINKQLSPYMAVVHSFWLGTSMIPDGRTKTYSFVAQVADEQGLLMARVDPERGSVDGRVHRAILGGACMAKLQVGVSQEGQSDQLLAEVDVGAHTWTANLKYGSMGGGLVYGCNYLQSITNRLAMGGEGMYIAANQNLVSSYTLKYSLPATSGDSEKTSMDTASTIVANYNSAAGALTVNYKRTVTPNRVTLGAELQCSPVSLESQVLLGAEFKLTRSKMAVCVDNSGKIQSTLEAKLGMAPGSPTLNFTADVDHAKDFMRFGYGLNIEG